MSLFCGFLIFDVLFGGFLVLLGFILWVFVFATLILILKKDFAFWVSHISLHIETIFCFFGKLDSIFCGLLFSQLNIGGVWLVGYALIH